MASTLKKVGNWHMINIQNIDIWQTHQNTVSNYILFLVAGCSKTFKYFMTMGEPEDVKIRSWVLKDKIEFY